MALYYVCQWKVSPLSSRNGASSGYKSMRWREAGKRVESRNGIPLCRWLGGMCGQLSSIKNVYWGTYTNIMEKGEGVYITHVNLQWQELLWEQQYTSPLKVGALPGPAGFT